MNKANAIPTPAIVTRPPELLKRTSDREAAPWTGVLVLVDEAPARAADDEAEPDPVPPEEVELPLLDPEFLPPLLLPLPDDDPLPLVPPVVEFLPLLPLLLPLPLLSEPPVASPVELFLLPPLCLPPPLPLLPVSVAVAAPDSVAVAAVSVLLPPLLCLARMKISLRSAMAA